MSIGITHWLARAGVVASVWLFAACPVEAQAPQGKASQQEPGRERRGMFLSRPDAGGTHALQAAPMFLSVDRMLDRPEVMALFADCPELARLPAATRAFFERWNPAEPWRGNGRPVTFLVTPLGDPWGAMERAIGQGIPGVEMLPKVQIDELRNAAVRELRNPGVRLSNLPGLARLYMWTRSAGFSTEIFREEYQGIRRDFDPLQSLNVAVVILEPTDFAYLQKAIHASRAELSDPDGFFSLRAFEGKGPELEKMVQEKTVIPPYVEECAEFLKALESDLPRRRAMGISTAWVTPISAGAASNMASLFGFGLNTLMRRSGVVPIARRVEIVNGERKIEWGLRFDGMREEDFWAEHDALLRGVVVAQRLGFLARSDPQAVVVPRSAPVR